MIDQDSHAQQSAATRRLNETIARLAAERQALVEELAAARQRAGEEAAAAAVARAEVERLRRLIGLHHHHHRTGRWPVTVTRMPAPTIDARPVLRPGGIVTHADLLYPDQQDPVGLDGERRGPWPPVSGRLCYIVWIAPRPDTYPDERRARWALHLVECRRPADG